MDDTPFSGQASLIHRTDPRIRLVLCLLLAFGMAGLTTFASGLGALILGAGLAASAKLPPGATLKRLVLVNGFIAFLWIMLPFSAPGETVLTLGPLRATREGILLAGLITLKGNAILLCIMALVATIPMTDMGQTLASLRLPDKFTVMFVLCYRYLHLIREEYERLAAAARIRCFRPGTNRHTYRTYGHLLGMLLVGSYERGRRVHQAMRLRAFQGRFHSLRPFAIRGRDLGVALGIALPALGLLLVEILARGHMAPWG
jgi:cobalt/nickel transport system permease protein